MRAGVHADDCFTPKEKKGTDRIYYLCSIPDDPLLLLIQLDYDCLDSRHQGQLGYVLEEHELSSE